MGDDLGKAYEGAVAWRPYLSYGLEKQVVLFESPLETEALWKYTFYSRGIPPIAQDEDLGLVVDGRKAHVVGKESREVVNQVAFSDAFYTSGLAVIGGYAYALKDTSLAQRPTRLDVIHLGSGKSEVMERFEEILTGLSVHKDNLLSYGGECFSHKSTICQISPDGIVNRRTLPADITALAAGKNIYVAIKDRGIKPTIVAYENFHDDDVVGLAECESQVYDMAANSKSVFVASANGDLECLDHELNHKWAIKEQNPIARGYPHLEASEAGVKVYNDPMFGINSYTLIDNEGNIITQRRR